MICGDNPNKINERQDALGLKTYTYVPSIGSIMQSGNLYVYCVNNPIAFVDANGNAIMGVLAVRFLFGAGAQFLSDVLRYIYDDNPNKTFDFNWQDYLASGVSNMISFGSSFGAKLLCSFFSSFVSRLISDLGRFERLDWRSVLKNIIIDLTLIDWLVSSPLTDDFLKSDFFNFAGKIDIDLSSDIGKLLKEFLKLLEETPVSTAISIFIDEL